MYAHFCLLLIWSFFSRVIPFANEITFPKAPEFLFGVATSSYQVEGAWNVSGKGENIWDRYTHQHPDLIRDHSNGDIACDSYHKFREDVQLLKDLGVNFYRFSLSWSRILPTGRSYKINPDGIRYYNELIDELIKNGITPMVTIFHWDTPQPLQDLGSFTNELMVDWYEEYVRVVFDNFGDRVKLWATFNEPRQTCQGGIGSSAQAPGLNAAGIGEYICAHNLLKAHARAYHVYDKDYRKVQKGKVGITLDSPWLEAISSSPADLQAAERVRLFLLAWYADPIFGKHGDYPKVMKDFIRERSLKEGFKQSRLPKFTPIEVAYIKGTYDFFGFNHYTSSLIQDFPNVPIGDPAFVKDMEVFACTDPTWPSTASDWFKVVPWGFTKVLLWLKERYSHDPHLEIYVTESGYSDVGQLNDTGRIDFYTSYLNAMKVAMNHGVNIKGYAMWSLLDNFEWTDGYSSRFGIYHVDFEDPNRKRTPKASVQFLKNVMATRTLKAVNVEKPANNTISSCFN